jgi:hypothetical protein
MAKRQKNRKHNGQKTEEQKTQWPKDRRTESTMAKRQKNRKHNGQKTEEQKTQWPKDRRTENTMAKKKKDNNDLEKITPKTKDRLTRTLLKTEGEL